VPLGADLAAEVMVRRQRKRAARKMPRLHRTSGNALCTDTHQDFTTQNTYQTCGTAMERTCTWKGLLCAWIRCFLSFLMILSSVQCLADFKPKRPFKHTRKNLPSNTCNRIAAFEGFNSVDLAERYS
jgi:hypothetical protein